MVVRGELARFVAFRVEQPGMQYFAAREVFFHFLFFQDICCIGLRFVHTGLVLGENLRLFIIFSDLPRKRSPQLEACVYVT